MTDTSGVNMWNLTMSLFHEKLPPLLMYLILNRLLPHRPNIAPMLFGNMTPSTKLGQGIIFSHVRSFSSLAMSGGKFAKSWHPQRVTIPDKNVEFKGLPVLNMHFSDENSAAVKDDMTIDQKIQTIDFWTGRTIFRYGGESGNSSQFALPSKNRPGPHRDKRDAKNDKKAQRLKSIDNVTNNKSGCMTKPVNLVRYDMSSFMESCVDAYCELAKVQKSDLPVVATPFTEAGIARPSLDEKEKPGRLQRIASKVLMRILFAARMARPDLLRATQSLAPRVTKWSVECEIALHRLVSYIKSTTDVYMEGFVGNSFDDCQLWLSADADHAGEFDSKSTSGCATFLVGPNWPQHLFSP